MLREGTAIVRYLAMTARERTTAFVLVAVCLVASFGLSSSQAETSLAQTSERPNIILILADDLDAKAHLQAMPNLKAEVVDKGMTLENAFVTNSVCCPSRSTILTGRYAHNHGVLTNSPKTGGFVKAQEVGLDKSTIATWLDS